MPFSLSNCCADSILRCLFLSEVTRNTVRIKARAVSNLAGYVKWFTESTAPGLNKYNPTLWIFYVFDYCLVVKTRNVLNVIDVNTTYNSQLIRFAIWAWWVRVLKRECRNIIVQLGNFKLISWFGTQCDRVPQWPINLILGESTSVFNYAVLPWKRHSCSDSAEKKGRFVHSLVSTENDLAGFNNEKTRFVHQMILSTTIT